MVGSKIVDIESERGSTMVEYALMLSLLALVCIFSLQMLGTNTGTQYVRAATGLNGTAGGGLDITGGGGGGG